MRSLLPTVAEQLFQDIQKSYQETSQSKATVVKGEKCDSWPVDSFNLLVAVALLANSYSRM